MGEQTSLLENDKLDPEIAKVADRVIALTAEKQSVKERLEVQSRSLFGLMKKAGKVRIRHGGFLIVAKEAKAKDQIVVKLEKPPAKKPAKGRGRKGRR